MVNWKSKKLGDLLLLANGLVLFVLLNLLASEFIFRLDLTEEKRYSIKPQTKAILKNLDDDVYVEVYLEGDLNAGFRRFQKAIRETLDEFRVYSHHKVKPVFVDPAAAKSQKAQNEFMTDLAAKGIQPTNVIDNRSGQRVERLIFPGAVVSYGGAERGVMLLKGNKAASPEEEINQSIEGIEYEFANAINNLVNIERKQIGMVHGHGELDSLNVASFYRAASEVYDIAKVNLSGDLRSYNILVIAKPTQPFSEHDKYALDQYIMQGGRVLMLLDKLDVTMDSASSKDYFAFTYNLNLDDQLFKYGLRINPDLVQDRSASPYPVVIGKTGNKPQVQFLDWPFFPLINHYANHPITKNIDAVSVKFVSSIDTVKAVHVRKTPLLMTSPFSRTLTAPVNVNVNDVLRRNIDVSAFSQSNVPVGYLLEGRFTSLFKNRFVPDGADTSNRKEESRETKIIVIADGDVARNEVNRRTGQPHPLGFDPYTQVTYANQDLLMNALAFLTDENGLISARNKEVKIRPLNREKIVAEKTRWQVINLVLPLVLLIGLGMIRSYVRRRKYAAFK
jgi:ABC-2 type transport system permease protein